MAQETCAYLPAIYSLIDTEKHRNETRTRKTCSVPQHTIDIKKTVSQ